MKTDKAYLKHILDSILFIEKYIGKNLTLEKFMSDDLLQNAIVRQLEIIGEASTLVSKQTQQKLNNIEWAKIIGMRNKLIHEYFGVDLIIVWTTIKEEIPKLHKEISGYLKQIVD